MTSAPASEIHPDVLQLAQQIVGETQALVADVETLDANKWLSHADKLESLNHQLQNLLVTPPPTPPATKSTTTTASRSNS